MGIVNGKGRGFGVVLGLLEASRASNTTVEAATDAYISGHASS